MAAEKACNEIFDKIRKSKLNFLLSETPYSAQLTIRKSFVNRSPWKPVQKSEPSPAVTENIGDMKDQIKQLKKQLDEKCKQFSAINEELRKTRENLDLSKTNTEILEAKIEKVETESMEYMNGNKSIVRGKDSEIKVLDGVVKHLKVELETNKQDLAETKNKFDVKEKCISKLKNKVESQSNVNENLEATVLKVSTENEKLRLKVNLLNEKIEDIEKEKDSKISEIENLEVIEYTIETNNNFEILAEHKTKASNHNQSSPTKDDEKSESKVTKIDFNNYKAAFRDFLGNFKEDGSENLKYRQVATQMVNNKYNMFHVFLKDIRRYNPNVGGFLANHYKDIDLDLTGILEQFIKEDLGVGDLKHGLYFNLIHK